MVNITFFLQIAVLMVGLPNYEPGEKASTQTIIVFIEETCLLPSPVLPLGQNSSITVLAMLVRGSKEGRGSQSVSLLTGPPLWFGLKYLKNYCTECHEFFFRYGWVSFEKLRYGTSPNASTLKVIPIEYVVVLSWHADQAPKKSAELCSQFYIVAKL